jgi:hypothetical protein
MEGQIKVYIFYQLARRSFLTHLVLPSVAALTLIVGIGSRACAADIVYDLTVDVLGVNATGTISTDGTMGSLNANNITDWSITLGSYITNSVYPPLKVNEEGTGVHCGG